MYYNIIQSFKVCKFKYLIRCYLIESDAKCFKRYYEKQRIKNIRVYSGKSITSSNAKELQAKGVLIRQENIRREKELKRLLMWYLNQPIETPIQKAFVKLDFPKLDVKTTNQIYLLAQLIKQAKNGNIEALRLLLQIGGILENNQ